MFRTLALAAALAAGAAFAQPAAAARPDNGLSANALTKNGWKQNGVRHNATEALHFLPPAIEALVLPGGFVVHSR